MRSPTYTYYERYGTEPYIYHMDLYRLEDVAWFASIWGLEILQDPTAILLIEWPEILESSIEPTKVVKIQSTGWDERKIEIDYNI